MRMNLAVSKIKLNMIKIWHDSFLFHSPKTFKFWVLTVDN